MNLIDIPVPDLDLIANTNELQEQNEETVSISFLELSQNSRQIWGGKNTKWSEYFGPSPSVWGLHTQKPNIQSNFEEMTKQALERSVEINPFQKEIPVGAEVSSTEAFHWSNARYNDIRPRLFDKGSLTHRLIDTGSMISTTKKEAWRC